MKPLILKRETFDIILRGRNLSRKDLAEILGISTVYLYKLISGMLGISYRIRLKLTTFLSEYESHELFKEPTGEELLRLTRFSHRDKKRLPKKSYEQLIEGQIQDIIHSSIEKIDIRAMVHEIINEEINKKIVLDK